MDMHTLFNVMLNYMKNNDKERLYTAVSSNDVHQIFSCASDIVDNSNCYPIDFYMNAVITDKRQKNAEKSDQLRLQGNKHYTLTVPQLKEALLWYIKALANAPKNSKQMMLAYSNISAVAFTIKAYKDCEANVDASLALSCTQDLKTKLEKRKADARKLQKSLEPSVDFSYLQQLLNFESERNEDVPSVHKDVTVKVDDKIVVARNDIAPGEIVAMERAFTSSHTDDILACYYCHSRRFFFIPCDNCEAMFCSEKCKEKCLEEYHRIECQITYYVGYLYKPAIIKLVTRTVIKLTLLMGWDKYIEASREIGAKRLQKATAQEAFDSQNPLSALSYVENEGPHRGKLYQGSLIFAVIVDSLSYVKGYFPQDCSEETVKLALGSVMIHLYAKFSRTIEIATPTYDLLTNDYKDRSSRNLGLFSFTSKLKQSCDPNLLVFGMNDSVALVTARKIKQGEEFTISYIDHFEDISVSHGCREAGSLLLRQSCMQATLNITCECRICIQNLDCDYSGAGDTSNELFMTSLEKMNAHSELLRSISDEETWENRMALMARALDLSGGSISTQRFTAQKYLQAIFHICQLLRTKNVAYDATTRASYGKAFIWPFFGKFVKPSMFQ